MTNYKPLYHRSSSSQRWIFSYADVLTILLVLFVAVSAQGLRKVEPPLHPAPPVTPPVAPAVLKPGPPEPSPDLLRAKHLLEEQGLKPTLEARGLVVSLPQAVLFSSGEDQVSPGALPVVGQVAEAIRGIPNKLSLIGHADAVPIHNRRFRDNWVLSVARSLSLLDVLNRRYGIPQERLSVAGDGSYNPQEPNDTAENRAANRCVEIVILREPAP